MKFALIIDGVVDTVAMERPGHFADETYKEDIETERDVLAEQQKIDADGKPMFDGDEPVMETVATVEIITETVERVRQVFVPDERFVECPDDVFAGFTHRKGKFAPPAPEPPSTDPNDYPLNRFQFEAFVLSLGLSIPALETAISALPLTIFEKSVGISRLRNATTYNRSHPLVEAVRAQIGMPVGDLNSAWLQASALR